MPNKSVQSRSLIRSTIIALAISTHMSSSTTCTWRYAFEMSTPNHSLSCSWYDTASSGHSLSMAWPQTTIRERLLRDFAFHFVMRHCRFWALLLRDTCPPPVLNFSILRLSYLEDKMALHTSTIRDLQFLNCFYHGVVATESSASRSLSGFLLQPCCSLLAVAPRSSVRCASLTGS